MKTDLGTKMGEPISPVDENWKYYPSITIPSEGDYKVGDKLTATFEMEVKGERTKEDGSRECTIELQSMDDIEPSEGGDENSGDAGDQEESGENSELKDISVKGAADSGEAIDMYADQMKKKKAKKEAMPPEEK